ARQDFELARDYDALDFRADSRLNSVIRAAAARHSNNGVHLADAAEILEQNSPNGIAGLNFFYEHVHLNFAGNYLLALNFAERIKALLPGSITTSDKGSWASKELCEYRLAVTDWDRQRVWWSIFDRISAPPFTGQFDHATFLKKCQARLDDVGAQTNSQTPQQAQRIYEQAVAMAPTDGFLHFNFAQFLGAKGDIAQATEEAKRVCELLPQVPSEFVDVGSLLVLQAKIDEAAEFFSHALTIQDNFAPALDGLGQILENRQKINEAQVCFKRALRADPDDVEADVNLGFLEQNRGNMNEAAVYYERAARLQAQGPADYFNQAVAAAEAGQLPNAIEFLGTAVQLKPEFWQAHYQLGVALAAQGQIREAEEQLWQSIIYRPDFASSHLNLGIMLMKQKRLDAALTQFQITLQLDPSNQPAKQYIAEIRASKNGGLTTGQ
ncbi:MAG TPA: tetratricopeptide repeat protein, partial [Candidatus Acidoferrum sp.]|nr:tetratricopeptide repeat protein [Candidatus Acidoferrum sp.]